MIDIVRYVAGNYRAADACPLEDQALGNYEFAAPGCGAGRHDDRVARTGRSHRGVHCGIGGSCGGVGVGPGNEARQHRADNTNKKQTNRNILMIVSPE